MLTANEWEYFIASAEDLSGDKSGDVRTFVKDLLIAYRDGEVRSAIEALGEIEPKVLAHEILLERWKQIESAIDAFQ